MRNTTFLVKIGIGILAALSAVACEEEEPETIRQIDIEDPYLRACLIDHVILFDWLYAHQYRDMGCSYRSIDSLVGIEPFVNLRRIELTGNSIIDITPLIELPSLRLVNMSRNSNFVDVAPFYEMESLETVVLDGCTNILCDDLQALIDEPDIDVTPRYLSPGENCREGSDEASRDNLR